MSTTSEPLERFVLAQEYQYAQALAELRTGRKKTHWIWYVLPQLRDLGRSQKARDYGLADLKEAAAYYAHPVLGPRLVECVGALLAHSGRGASEVLGEVDAMKFRSCLTLFARAVPEESVFSRALDAFYEGSPDQQTLRLLGAAET